MSFYLWGLTLECNVQTHNGIPLFLTSLPPRQSAKGYRHFSDRRERSAFYVQAALLSLLCAVTALPHRSAKAFRGTIHWMVPLLCLLTFLGGTLRVPFRLRGSAPPPAAFEKAGETFMFAPAFGLCFTGADI